MIGGTDALPPAPWWYVALVWFSGAFLVVAVFLVRASRAARRRREELYRRLHRRDHLN